MRAPNTPLPCTRPPRDRAVCCPRQDHQQMGYRRTPPLRHCRECGCALRAWRDAPLCPRCTRPLALEQPAESLREFRRRFSATAHAELAPIIGVAKWPSAASATLRRADLAAQAEGARARTANAIPPPGLDSGCADHGPLCRLRQRPTETGSGEREAVAGAGYELVGGRVEPSRLAAIRISSAGEPDQRICDREQRIRVADPAVGVNAASGKPGQESGDPLLGLAAGFILV
jgi:hypothetical protein